jgi:hypothetical protein
MPCVVGERRQVVLKALLLLFNALGLAVGLFFAARFFSKVDKDCSHGSWVWTNTTKMQFAPGRYSGFFEYDLGRDLTLLVYPTGLSNLASVVVRDYTGDLATSTQCELRLECMFTRFCVNKTTVLHSFVLQPISAQNSGGSVDNLKVCRLKAPGLSAYYEDMCLEGIEEDEFTKVTCKKCREENSENELQGFSGVVLVLVTLLVLASTEVLTEGDTVRKLQLKAKEARSLAGSAESEVDVSLESAAASTESSASSGE